MVIWRGGGLVVVVGIFVGFFLAETGADFFWGKPLPLDKKNVVELSGMLLAAIVTYLLNILIQRISKPRVLIDKETNQEVTLTPKHDLFFIPVKYWPFIFVALTIARFFTT